MRGFAAAVTTGLLFGLMSPASATVPVHALASPMQGVVSGHSAVITATTVTTSATGPLVGLRGRGYGHGRGMSQWGARGAAEQGLTSAQILAFYYPGTAVSTIGNPTIRVRLTAMTSQVTTVRAEAGLTLTDGACTAELNRTGATWWRVVRTTGTWRVEGLWANSTGTATWQPFPSACTGFSSAAGLMFVGDGSMASSALTLQTPIGNRDYRGGLRATLDNRPGAGQVTTVNHLAMDQYLESVVPAEMPAFWHVEAVKAQSVAARSYGAASLGKAYTSDICDTTTCQVYPGLTTSAPPTATSNAAVAGTSGQILRYGTAVALTEFGATNGGQVAGSTLPYQVPKADPYDGRSTGAPVTWKRLDLSARTIEAKWPTIGTLRSLTVTRDGKGASFGGRVTGVTLVGTAASRTLTGEAFRAGLGLWSTYFVPEGSSVGSDFAGNGFSDVIARDGSGNLWNYPSNGRGGWLPRTLIADRWPAAPEVLAPGDFSGDGISDLLTRSSTGALTLHRGNGVGKVASSSTVGSGWHGFTTVLAPGDLDGDGAVDILARDAAGVLWLYPTKGNGTWKSRVSKGSGWASLRELEAVGDFDGDGGIDLMGKNAAGTLYLLRFARTGAYLGPKALSSGFGAFSAFTGMGDVDGDGPVDLVVRDSTGRLWAYRGNGTGGFLPRLLIGSGWSTLAFGS